jgi:hypothetical protein
MPDGALVTVPPPVLLTVSVGSAAKAGETSRVRAASPSSRVRVVATMRRVPLLPYTVVSNVPSSHISPSVPSAPTLPGERLLTVTKGVTR